MNAKNNLTELTYGYRLNPVTKKREIVISYTEPETGDEITLISPPYQRIYAYRNGIPTDTTKVMVLIQTKVSGWLSTAELAAIFQVNK